MIYHEYNSSCCAFAHLSGGYSQCVVREVVLAAALYILAVGRVVVAVSKSCTEDAEGAGVPHKLHTFGVSYIIGNQTYTRK